MPRKRKYESFFEYTDDGSARCLIGGCSKPSVSRSQSNGMPKHLRVHHPTHYYQMSAAFESKPGKQFLSSTSSSCSAKTDDSGGSPVNGEAVVQTAESSETANSGPEPQGVGEAGETGDHAEQAVAAEVVVADASDDNEQQAEEVADPTSDDEFEVEAILEKRVTVEYRLKWKDYGDEFNSWEKASNLVHCEELLEDFHAPHPPDTNEDIDALALPKQTNDEEVELPDL